MASGASGWEHDRSSRNPPPPGAPGPSGSTPRGPTTVSPQGSSGAGPPPPVGGSSRAPQQYSRQFTSILAQASNRHAHAQAQAYGGAASRALGGGATRTFQPTASSRAFPPPAGAASGIGATRQFQAGAGGMGSFAGGSFTGGNPSRMYGARTRVLPPPAPGAAAAAAAPPAAAARGLSPQQVAKIEDLFTAFDKDGSGSIDKLEMKFAMTQLGINVSQEEFEEIFATMDRNGDGSIDFEEYVAVMSGYMGEQNMHQDMIAMYQLFADKRTGRISFRTLKRGVLNLGLEFVDDEIRGMFYSADKDGNGEIDIDEFTHIAELTGIC